MIVRIIVYQMTPKNLTTKNPEEKKRIMNQSLDNYVGKLLGLSLNQQSGDLLYLPPSVDWGPC